jgi:putative hydrolase of the HAD superfamily
VTRHHERVGIVLLDLDGTLVDHEAAEREAIQGWIREARLPAQVGSVPSATLWHDLAESAFVAYRAGLLTFQGQRRHRVSQFLAALGIDVGGLDDAALDSQFGEYLHRYEAAWRPFPDAVDALTAVRQMTRVAVLSNGDHDQQVDKVRRTGLAAFVEEVITSSDLGVAKPDPRAFIAAADRLGVKPGEVLYCGDRLEVDAVAASAAGLVGVWLNRAGNTPLNLNVTTIATLSELPALIAK